MHGKDLLCECWTYLVPTVPDLRDLTPAHLGAGEVDPGLTGGTLYHGPPAVWLPTVASDLACLLLLQVI